MDSSGYASLNLDYATTQNNKLGRKEGRCLVVISLLYA